MVRTQSLIGGLNMRKGYAMYYHVEMSKISRVNLQIGLHNEKVQDVVHQWRRLAGGTLVLQAGDRGRGKGERICKQAGQ